MKPSVSPAPDAKIVRPDYFGIKAKPASDFTEPVFYFEPYIIVGWREFPPKADPP